jgi:hypothetical protein
LFIFPFEIVIFIFFVICWNLHFSVACADLMLMYWVLVSLCIEQLLWDS